MWKKIKVQGPQNGFCPIIKYETKEKHQDFMVETFAVKNHEQRIKLYYESKHNFLVQLNKELTLVC